MGDPFPCNVSASKDKTYVIQMPTDIKCFRQISPCFFFPNTSDGLLNFKVCYSMLNNYTVSCFITALNNYTVSCFITALNNYTVSCFITALNNYRVSCFITALHPEGACISNLTYLCCSERSCHMIPFRINFISVQRTFISKRQIFSNISHSKWNYLTSFWWPRKPDLT